MTTPVYTTYFDNDVDTDDMTWTVPGTAGGSCLLIVFHDDVGELNTPTHNGSGSAFTQCGDIQDPGGRVQGTAYYCTLSGDETTVTCGSNASNANGGVLITDSDDALDFTTATEVADAEDGFTSPSLSLSASGLDGGNYHFMFFGSELGTTVIGDQSVDFTNVVDIGSSNIAVEGFVNSNSETTLSETLTPANCHCCALVIEVAAGASDQTVNLAAVTVSATPGTLGIDMTVKMVDPGVSVTPGTAGFDMTMSPAPITVTASPGTMTVAYGINLADVAIGVSPGTTKFDMNVDLAPVTVTASPGSVSLGLGISFSGPTVSVTPGTAQIDQTVKMADPGVVITAGAMTIVAADFFMDGPTVAITPGGAKFDLNTVMAAPAVIVTPGTAQLDLTLMYDPVTVGVTPGDAQLDMTVGLAGANVTVTGGAALIENTIGMPLADVAVTVGPGAAQFDQSIDFNDVTVNVMAGEFLLQQIVPAVGPGLHTVQVHGATEVVVDQTRQRDVGVRGQHRVGVTGDHDAEVHGRHGFKVE